MIYVVGGIKGGSGKTTIATNLAVSFSYLNGETLLIDSDDQESATDFTNWRNEHLEDKLSYTAVQLTGLDVRKQTLSLASKYKEVIIDTGGRDTSSQRAALSVADVALFPFVPRSLDIWTVEKLSKLIEEVCSINPDMTSYAFINKADAFGADNDGVSSILKDIKEFKFLPSKIGNRKSFANAVSKGLGICELKPTDHKAVSEFTNFFELVTGKSLKKDNLMAG